MSNSKEYTCATPKIASFVILRKGNLIAFVKRKNTGHLDGYYGLPAGKVEWKEPYSAAAVREAKEEVGVTITSDNLYSAHLCHRHDLDADWIDNYFEVKEWQGEVINNEPEKCEEVAWFELDNLPENTIVYVKLVLQAIARGESYSEYGWN